MDRGIWNRNDMEQRAFKIFCVLAGLNSLLFFLAFLSLVQNPGAGPEGLGTALFAYLTLFLSLMLSGVALNYLSKTSRWEASTRRALLAALFGAFPMLFYVLVVILPRRLSQGH
jgi:hypothetical protein